MRDIPRPAARALVRAAWRHLRGHPDTRALPGLHLALHVGAFAVPWTAAWASSLALGPAGRLAGYVAATLLGLATALAAASWAQATAAATARARWLGDHGEQDDAPQVGRIFWRGVRSPLVATDLVARLYEDAPPCPHRRVFGRVTVMAVVLGSLWMGMVAAYAVLNTALDAADPRHVVGAIGLGAAGAGVLALGVAASMGILGAVVAAAERHQAWTGTAPPGFDALGDAPRRPTARPTVRFRRG